MPKQAKTHVLHCEHKVLHQKHKNSMSENPVKSRASQPLPQCEHDIPISVSTPVTLLNGQVKR